ncbi:hypothetical protein GOV03_04960 [Candidatus Woesearchaeota archaeon]|nr:hypothetical protein [Candidatus Woesearchaeota archaeon]
MEEKRDGTSIFSKFKWNTLLSVFVVVAMFFLMRPLITSYGTASLEQEYTEQISELNQELVAAQTGLEETQKFKQELFDENKRLNNNLLSCREDLTATNKDVENLNENIFSLKKDLSNMETEEIDEIEQEKVELHTQLTELETEKENLQSDYNTLAQNLANSICCKQKIDKWEINYYSIVDNDILCLEEGETEISCPFS